MVEQRSPKPSVACSTRVSPAKSKHSVLAFCFQKKGRASLHAKHLLPNAVASDATLRFAIPSLRFFRLPSLCQKQALCACFLFSKKRESESPRKAFVTKFSPADATLRSAIFCIFSVLRLKELCAIIFCKIFRGGKFDRLYGYFIV